MFGLKKFLLLAFIGLWACSVGALESEGSSEGNSETKSKCVNLLEDAFKGVVVPNQVQQLMDVVKEFYPDTPFIYVVDPHGSPIEKKLLERPYPIECDILIGSFALSSFDEHECFWIAPNQDDSLKKFIAEDKRLNELWSAGETCVLSKRLHRDDITEEKLLERVRCINVLNSAFQGIAIPENVQKLLAKAEVGFGGRSLATLSPKELLIDLEKKIRDSRYPEECGALQTSVMGEQDAFDCMWMVVHDDNVLKEFIDQNKRINEFRSSLEVCWALKRYRDRTTAKSS